MADVKQMLNKIEAKLRMLEFTRSDTPRIQEKNELKSLERQEKVFSELIDSIHEQKVLIQTAKIEKGDNPEDVTQWTLEMEEKIEKYEQVMAELHGDVEKLRAKAREEDGLREDNKRRQRFEEELKLEEAKMQMKHDYEKKLMEESKSSKGNLSQVKLPKLVITKFQGTPLDWQRFWSQFETEIDKAEITQVAKFSYLKELLVSKVRMSIDGLPFTSEGYERAKNILKTKYGKPSEVSNAHVQQIISLQTVRGTQPGKIHEFYETLVTNVHALETLGKIKEINGYVRVTLDKLPDIRADLVRLDEDWQDWGFSQMIEALRKWCERNPVGPEDQKYKSKLPKDKSFQANQGEWKPRPCVYCESTQHKSVDCKTVTSVTERRKVLSSKKLCFNCAGTRHRASECRSKTTCQKCNERHHTSICNKGTEQMMVASVKGEVIYPVVVVLVDGIKVRALLDTGSGSSYASAALIDRLSKRPTRTEHKRIDMMMCSTTQKIEVYNVNVSSITGKFAMETEVNKVDKGVLLSVPNPRYAEKINQYPHLEGVVMDDKDSKPVLPIHLILGASEYSRIKTVTKPKIGNPCEPVAELTAFGWSMMSPGKEVNLSNTYLTRTSFGDYEQLCNLDVLGLEDRAQGDQQSVYDEFKEQLSRSDEGWYETGLIWKQGHGPLPSNEHGSLKRLDNLVKKLRRDPNLMNEYDEIIQNQVAEGVVERVTSEPVGKEFYLPHKPVVRESAESTKTRIVFDASAKANDKCQSLNDCLETGPPLQNILWDVLVRNRLKPVALAGDLKKAFHQIRIRPEHRDVLRFHWVKEEKSEIEVLRFTRALFGLVQSPFLLGATLKRHLESLKERYPNEVAEIEKCLYVDDVITEGDTKEEVLDLKETTVAIFEEAKFELHKWHSNESVLEAKSEPDDGKQSYAKDQLGVKAGETKLLGLPWNKNNDTISVTFPQPIAETTKREMLRFLASIYDPLGLVSPTTLSGKLMYRQVCDQHLPWDAKVSESVADQWCKFENSLPGRVEIPRSITSIQEPTKAIDLHVFGDTSGVGTSAAVYAVVHQESGVNQGLLTAKSRLAKKGLSIPRLELVSAHMAANLAENTKNALDGQLVRSVTGWLDSTVALYWIKGGGAYKQFVANRVRKINEKEFIEWRHVTTDQNPADVGSRGCLGSNLPKIWLNGPVWLPYLNQWPESIVSKASKETEEEAKLSRELFAAAVEINDEFEELLSKHCFWSAVRIMAWIRRFLTNCKLKKLARVTGPLTTKDIHQQVEWWIKRVQNSSSGTDEFQEDKLRLNLQLNSAGLYECRGRIQGEFPLYLPPAARLSKKIVEDAHIVTLHGGVGLTMTLVRRDYWIPRLRQLTKKVINNCFGCKKFRATAFRSPPPGNLPTDRTIGSTPFQVIGVDYAGPMEYKISSTKNGKAHILLFACSLTRGIHLELLKDQTTEGFIRSLKRFVARRGRPSKIYSDNAKSFVAAAKWLRTIMKDEKLQNYLAHQYITWQFNLSRAPWWGGQFERLVGLVKRALYKSSGRAKLTWNEFEEVILDVEIALNNRPLSYVEDDIQLPVLTPNSMMFEQSNLLPEEDIESIEDGNLRKRARYLRRCKDALWSRWSGEYVKGLRERHNLNHKTKQLSIKPGDVVLITSDERNRGKWNIGVVVKLIKGRDGVVRAVRLRAGKSFIERAVQQLCPMELSCDIPHKTEEVTELNPRAR